MRPQRQQQQEQHQEQGQLTIFELSRAYSLHDRFHLEMHDTCRAAVVHFMMKSTVKAVSAAKRTFSVSEQN